MAERIEHFSSTVDPNGEGLDFLTFAGGDGTVVAISVHFPSGCADRVGAQVFYAGLQVIPRTAGQYLRGNAEGRRFELAGFPTGSSWSVFLNSTDIYQHTIRFDFEIDELTVSEGGTLDFPPLVLMTLDQELPGIVESIDLTGVPAFAGGGFPTISGGTVTLSGLGGGVTVDGTQAELDSLRLAILSSTSPQQTASMQARIDQLIAEGFV